MALCYLWLVKLMSVTGFFYHGVFTTSVVAAATYNFIANQRPRFQIPHGNLSYFNSPQWEVLYFLKFGIFPFYSTSSPFFNRTQYLNRIRTIKTYMDRKNGKAEYENMNEIDPIVATVTDLPQHEQQHQNAPQNGKILSVSVSARTLPVERKNNMKAYHPFRFSQIKRNVELVKEKRLQTVGPIQKKTTTTMIGDDNLINDDIQLNGEDSTGDLDYFLADGDPSWRSRVTKQSEMGGPSRGFFTGTGGGVGHSGGPGLAAEMTFERKIGRKFQTQGWKK